MQSLIRSLKFQLIISLLDENNSKYYELNDSNTVDPDFECIFVDQLESS